MYSPDYADKDPRNPLNYSACGTTHSYICPNQFDDMFEGLIDVKIEDEGAAMVEAKRLAILTGHRVVVETFSVSDTSDHWDKLGEQTVFPWEA